MRKQQDDDKKAILEALHQLKKDETDQIKKVSLKNATRIKEIREQAREEKKKKHDEIINSQKVTKMKVSNFWSLKLKDYNDEHEKRKIMHLKVKSQKDMLLARLEEEEMELLRRLEQSQDVHEQVSTQLENAITLSHNEFVKQFGPISPITLAPGTKKLISSHSEYGSTHQSQLVNNNSDINNIGNTNNNNDAKRNNNQEFLKSEQQGQQQLKNSQTHKNSLKSVYDGLEESSKGNEVNKQKQPNQIEVNS